jgi:hypothetical protein
MLFNLFKLFIVFIICLTRYSFLTALLVTILICIISFILWFFLEIISRIISVGILKLIEIARGKHSDMTSMGLNNKTHKNADYHLIFSGAFISAILLTFTNILHVSHFLIALVFFGLTIDVLIAYVDRVVTKMQYKLIPTLIEAVIYLIFGISLLS